MRSITIRKDSLTVIQRKEALNILLFILLTIIEYQILQKMRAMLKMFILNF